MTPTDLAAVKARIEKAKTIPYPDIKDAEELALDAEALLAELDRVTRERDEQSDLAFTTMPDGASVLWSELHQSEKARADAESKRADFYSGFNAAYFDRAVAVESRVARLEAELAEAREALDLFRKAKASIAADAYDGVDEVARDMLELAASLAGAALTKGDHRGT